MFSCRNCLSKKLIKVVNIGSQPLSGVFYKKKTFNLKKYSLDLYQCKKSNLINNYPKVFQDLMLAEKKRKIYCVQNFIKLFIPNNLLSIIRKIRNKRINY